MKAKRFILPLVAVLGVSLFSTNTTFAEENAAQNTEVKEITKPSVKEYDGNGNLIKVYSQEEIEKLFVNGTVQAENKMEASGKVSAQAKTVYKSTPTTIKDNIYVKSGARFPDPGYVLLDPIGKVDHVVVRAYNSSGAKVRTTVLENFYGSVSIPYTDLKRGQSYKFNLARGSKSKAYIYLDFIQVGYYYN